MIALKMNSEDNVAVVVEDTTEGSSVMVNSHPITAVQPVRAGHKIACSPIAKGEMIIKYGKVIGQASQDISIGEWVHCHNVLDITEQLCQEYANAYRAKERALS